MDDELDDDSDSDFDSDVDVEKSSIVEDESVFGINRLKILLQLVSDKETMSGNNNFNLFINDTPQ